MILSLFKALFIVMLKLPSRRHKTSEPVFVNVYGAQESISPAYVAWWASTTNKVVVLAQQPGNRFLGSLKGLTNMGSVFCNCSGLPIILYVSLPAMSHVL
jgi:hypothetical protein